MSRLLLLGPPGAGKGTQAVEIARQLGVPHLSTGDLLRAAARAGSALGLEADRYMREGRLVPDDLVLRLLKERMAVPDCRAGYVLDGYPRTLAQAQALDEFSAIDRVVSFEIPEGVLVERLTARRSCPECGTVYNLVSRPPKTAGRCDRDGGILIQRPDDTEAIARTRLAIYRKETAPLLEFYRSRKLLVAIDASGPVDAVTARIHRVVGAGPTARTDGRQS